MPGPSSQTYCRPAASAWASDVSRSDMVTNACPFLNHNKPRVPRMGTKAGRRLGTVAVLAVVLGATFLPACSSDKGSDGASPKGTDATTATTAPARPNPPEKFRGAVDGFYEVPKPLPHGEPGQLIRVQEIGRDAGRVSVRIMYHSRDAQDHDRAVTGIATYPLRAA